MSNLYAQFNNATDVTGWDLVYFIFSSKGRLHDIPILELFKEIGIEAIKNEYDVLYFKWGYRQSEQVLLNSTGACNNILKAIKSLMIGVCMASVRDRHIPK